MPKGPIRPSSSPRSLGNSNGLQKREQRHESNETSGNVIGEDRERYPMSDLDISDIEVWLLNQDSAGDQYKETETALLLSSSTI
jgi:hypothetical protein